MGNKWQNSFDIVEQRIGSNRRADGKQECNRQYQKEKQAKDSQSPKMLVHDMRLIQSEAVTLIHFPNQQKVSIDVGDSPVYSLRLAINVWQ